MRLSPLFQRLGATANDHWDTHREACRARSRGKDVLLLTIGDPDLATPFEVTDTAVRALLDGDTHYTECAGRPSLREAIARLHSDQSECLTDANEVVVCSGAQGALFSACMSLFGPGDEVLVPDPVYLSYEATVRASGAEPVSVSTIPSNLRLDGAALRNAVTARTRGIIIANPCNPVGHVLRASELLDVAAIASEFDLWVISDEVYSSLTYDAPHAFAASVSALQGRTVTIGSLSKSHAMTGWRCGWAIAPLEAADAMGALSSCLSHGLPGFIQAAAVEAIRIHAECAGRTRAIFRRRRDIVLSMLSGLPGIVPIRPEAGMFMLVDVRGTGMGSAGFARALLTETGVAVMDGAAFGSSTDGFIRLSFAVSEDHLVDACHRIADCIGKRMSRVA